MLITKRLLATALPAAMGLALAAGLLAVLGGAAGSAAAAPLSGGTIRYVRPSGSDTANACANVVSPCQTIQWALDQAQAGDEIRVAAGVYTSAGGTVANIRQTVTLQGGWNGTFVQHDPATRLTILDGQGLAPVIVISPTTVPVGAQMTPAVDGLVVIHGQGQSADCGVGVVLPADCGGGMASLYADPLIINNVISDNVASDNSFGFGGGIYLFHAGAGALISGNLVYSNIANISGTGLGGGILEHASLATIQANHIQRNHDSNFGTTGLGAGIQLFFSHANILNNDIRENVSSNRGGGIQVNENNGSMLISGNTLLSNTAVSQGGAAQITGDVAVQIISNTVAYNQATDPSRGRGGGLRISGDNAGIVIQHNDIYSNVAAWGGGAGIDLSATGLVDGNSLHDNQTGGWGAALVFSGTAGAMTATNNLVVNNLGGGIEAISFTTSAAIVNNTVVGSRNSISGAAGTGILVTFDFTPALPITTTIVNNIVLSSAVCGLDIFNAPVLFSHHNDVSANTVDYCAADSSGNLSVDPLFVAAGAGNYHLSAASTLIDAGSNAEAPPIDKDGVSRPQGPAVEIGAYEVRLIADVRLTQSVVPGLVAPGQPVIFTLAYTNTGPQTATGVVITDAVPAGLTQVTYNASGALITATGGLTYTWQVQDLAPGTGGSIRVVGIADPALSGTAALTNRAGITSAGVDGTPSNNSANAAAVLAYPLHVVVIGAGSGSVSSSPPGLACGAFCTANYAYGTVVTLAAAPAGIGYLAGWSGACSGRALCVSTITGPEVVTATFELGWRINLPLAMK